ncbi:organic cation transporter protein-like [Pseudomyrmex gracilis]|uniref:organic cation transporter protein-like n=1 Tax=Pseudomyrmex gracilis TaxID=219809 RepID=UPI0009950C80|nr:organic cation transporter protein-like [Pseudomyrmex gracilis]
MNAEEVKVGCFQMVLVVLLGINYVIVAMSHALPIFHNHTPKFYCQVKNSTGRSYGCQSYAANTSIDVNLTSTSPEILASSCSGDYRFVTEFEESSVVTEWSLICEKQYLSFLGPTVYYAGVLLGAWIAGLLTDRIGRLPVQAICLYAQGTMAVALYVVQDYPAFLALRGLQGVFVQGLQNSTYILSLELFPARSRTLIALIMQIFWSIGLVLLTALSYVIPDWRILQLAVSVPTAVTVLYIWIIPESPRWLLAKGKSTEADMALERIAKYNSCCCCARSRAEKNREKKRANSNATPIKPERKSRVTSVDLKKTRTDENQRDEATNLLNGSEPTEHKLSKRASKANSTNSENRFSTVELRRETSNIVEDRRDLPSSSKINRKSKALSGCDNQRISLREAEGEVVLRRTKMESGREGKEEARDEKKQDETSSMLRTTFESAKLRKYAAVMVCQWLTSAMACDILNNLAPNFPLDRHITFALTGGLEMVTYTFVYFVLSRYGRRLPVCIYQSLNGVVCMLIAARLILTTADAPSTDLVWTIMLLFGRVTVTSTVSIVYLYTVEVFPTVVRGSCLGLCVVFAKIGNLSMPHLLLSGQHVPVPVPLLAVGMFCLVSGALALILPETLTKVLPDHTADVERMIGDSKTDSDDGNAKTETKEEDSTQKQILREKLFSEDWVDAGNGILVNFTENKTND